MLLLKQGSEHGGELGPVTGTLSGRFTVSLMFDGGVVTLSKADCIAALDGVTQCALHAMDPDDDIDGGNP